MHILCRLIGQHLGGGWIAAREAHSNGEWVDMTWGGTTPVWQAGQSGIWVAQGRPGVEESIIPPARAGALVSPLVKAKGNLRGTMLWYPEGCELRLGRICDINSRTVTVTVYGPDAEPAGGITLWRATAHKMLTDVFSPDLQA